MSLTTDTANHSAIQYSESIDNQVMTICEPLKHLGITHFGHFKFLKDGTYLKICNNNVWTKLFIVHDLVDKLSAFAETIVNLPLAELDIQIWPGSKGNDCLSALYEFNVSNGVSLTIKHADFIDVYYFATEKDNNRIFDLYINRMDLLIKFKCYFQEKASDLLKISDKSYLAIQKSKHSFFMEANSPFFQKSNIDINSFYRETSISNYYLNGTYSHLYLTRREMECLWYLSQGRSSKEIGKAIGISYRTVEAYITKIKFKTGANLKSQLIDIFLQSDLKNISKREIETQRVYT